MNRNINNILIDDGRRGIVSGMPDAEYHAIERLNPSSVAAGLIEAPVAGRRVDVAGVRYAFESPNAGTTDAMDRGSLADILLLTPDRERELVAVWDGARRQGAEWDGFEDAAIKAGQMVVRRRDYDETRAAVAAVRFNARVAEILADVTPHVAIFSREGRCFVKGQVDAVSGDRIVDLKTTGAGMDYRALQRTIRTFAYREKMALYKRWYERETGREIVRCINLFLSLVPPYRVVRVDHSTSAIEWATERMLLALEAVESATVAGSWPTYYREDMAEVAPWEMDDDGDEVTYG